MLFSQASKCIIFAETSNFCIFAEIANFSILLKSASLPFLPKQANFPILLKSASLSFLPKQANFPILPKQANSQISPKEWIFPFSTHTQMGPFGCNKQIEYLCQVVGLKHVCDFLAKTSQTLRQQNGLVQKMETNLLWNIFQFRFSSFTQTIQSWQ